jgi:two-component system sensor histidine kinase/response regulator
MALFDRRPASEAGNPPSAHRFGVLLVDDEIMNLQALGALLEEDFRVHTASDGARALALLADPEIAAGIQVVISDQRMPRMTGVELLTRIRAQRPDIKCLLLTGYNDMSAVVGAINDAGIYRYMQKPVEIQELRLAVLRATEAWQLEHDNRELMAALSRSYERLADLDAAKTSFLRYLSHEVNTPLNWLAATTVIDRAALRTETLQMIDYVDRGRDRLYGLVSAVVRYFEAAGLDVVRQQEPVNLSPLLSQVANNLRNTQAGQFSLQVEQPEILMLETDADVLREVLGHLIENAVTHSQRGDGSAEVVVRARPEGLQVIVEVHNSGRTPDAETLAQLFQPFFFCGSLHGVNGFGLSLATARALAAAVGGALDAAPNTVFSSGLCLRLALPRRMRTAGGHPLRQDEQKVTVTG